MQLNPSLSCYEIKNKIILHLFCTACSAESSESLHADLGYYFRATCQLLLPSVFCASSCSELFFCITISLRFIKNTVRPQYDKFIVLTQAHIGFEILQ